MAVTPSTMLPLGKPAPDFSLPEPLTGKTVSLKDYDGAPLLLVAFICNHCPYVIHLKPALVSFAREYAPDLQVVAISSNSPETHPQDGPGQMAEEARKYDYPFPYLFDRTQEVAKAYRAACTPEFYLFDRERRLIYRGRFDETRPNHASASESPSKGVSPTGDDLRNAVNLALEGKRIPEENQKPSIGCNIKWKPGNEPDYA